MAPCSIATVILTIHSLFTYLSTWLTMKLQLESQQNSLQLSFSWLAHCKQSYHWELVCKELVFHCFVLTAILVIVTIYNWSGLYIFFFIVVVLFHIPTAVSRMTNDRNGRIKKSSQLRLRKFNLYFIRPTASHLTIMHRFACVCSIEPKASQTWDRPYA